MKTAASAAAQDGDAASPCTNVCKMSPLTGYCEGCYRSIGEIAGWSAYSDAEKRAVLARLPGRKTPQ